MADADHDPSEPRDDGRSAPTRYLTVTAHLVRWILLGAVSGVLAGVASFVFLEALDAVTEYRLENEWLILGLPAAGLAIGAAYHYLGGRAAEGHALLLDEIHQPTQWIPRRMAPLVLGGTLASHLFGASVGREGTALQMSGSLTDWFSRTMRLGPADRRILLIASLSGGFGAVFGVPLAGAVFGMEVQAVGRMRYDALIPALTASVVGNLVVQGLGHDHVLRPELVGSIDATLALKVALAGTVFGLVSILFIEATHLLKRVMDRVGWPPLRPMVGGFATLALVGAFGTDYLGLSLPLIGEALRGQETSLAVPVLKLVFTVVALGCAFPGGEVTPLFVIGATLGAALAPLLDVPVPVLAAVGFVAVFAAAANTPLACTIMGVELFGGDLIVAFAIGCVVAYVASSHRGIYATQRIHTAKGPDPITGRPRLSDWRRGSAGG
jgi:H+/Cl- antiporter ClcA